MREKWSQVANRPKVLPFSLLHKIYIFIYVCICWPSVLLNLVKHGMLMLSLLLLFLKRPYCCSCFIVLGQVFGSKCGDFGGFCLPLAPIRIICPGPDLIQLT